MRFRGSISFAENYFGVVDGFAAGLAPTFAAGLAPAFAAGLAPALAGGFGGITGVP